MLANILLRGTNFKIKLARGLADFLVYVLNFSLAGAKPVARRESGKGFQYLDRGNTSSAEISVPPVIDSTNVVKEL